MNEKWNTEVVYNLFERRWARWDSGLGLVGLVVASSQSTPPEALAWTRRWCRTPPGNSCLAASDRSTPPLRHLHIKYYNHFLSLLLARARSILCRLVFILCSVSTSLFVYPPHKNKIKKINFKKTQYNGKSNK